MTQQEKVELLIEALKVLTKDADEVERKTVKQLLVAKLENL